MLESLTQNLINIGWAMLIFLAAYLANVAFSLWYNIKIQHEAFDKDKLFATQVGWAIPEEYSDLFADLVIIGAVLLVSCKYIKEAYTKFTAILNAKTGEETENE